MLDQAPPPADTPVVQELVVRATALPRLVSETAFSTITLDADALAGSQRTDEALRRVPGVSLFRRTSSLSANPTTQGLSLRAIAPSGAGRALITLDGVPLNDPFGGWVLWSQLPPEAIGRATIVRGAGAGPYGAGALTGTVALESLDDAPEPWLADLSIGELGSVRGAVVADVSLGEAGLLIAASGERTDGYVPVRGRDQGAADAPTFLEAGGLSARLTAPVGEALLSARLGVYDEQRGAGLDYAESAASGLTGSVALTRQARGGAMGWRLQLWGQSTDFANRSAAVAAGRRATTPANDQYETPATGVGFNAALRRSTTSYEWELGVDGRAFEGEVRERFRFMSGTFTRDREAGGRTSVIGAYVEASRSAGPWLVTGNLRADAWSATDSRRIERDVLTGATTLESRAPDADGITPTARAAVRYRLADGAFLRAAGYSGFRPPTLNELHRPFRVGNDITEANPELEPERLYGGELGAGRETDDWRVSVTAFWNRIEDPIANVTIGAGPGTFPIAGFVPAGGVLRQRQNAGAVKAMGLEVEAERRLSDRFEVRAALAATDARVDGGASAPQLTGKRPAQAPIWTATTGAGWQASDRLMLSADLRYESGRFEDDLNTRRLAPALTADVRAGWRLTDRAEVYVAAENLFDAEVETSETADGVEGYATPRVLRVGVRLTGF
jgi:outer membrane receptor protein involved in Fe transport